MNYILTAEIERNGFLIGIYPTLQEAEKMVNDLVDLSLKYDVKDMEKLNGDLKLYRMYPIKNDYPSPLPSFQTTNGAFTLSIYKSEIPADEFVEALISKKQFQSTLFSIEVMDNLAL